MTEHRSGTSPITDCHACVADLCRRQFQGFCKRVTSFCVFCKVRASGTMTRTPRGSFMRCVKKIFKSFQET
jgi:hypothetical protein